MNSIALLKNTLLKSMQKTYSLLNNHPKTLFLHITNACNFDCQYCYSDTRPISIDWMKQIEDSKKIGIKNVVFLGGEPFCDPHLFDYLEKCKKNGQRVEIFTNGALLTESILQKLKKYTVKLIIKFDEEENYRKYTDPKQYQKVIDNINKAKQLGLKVVLHICINKQNHAHIRQLVDYINQKNLLLSYERYIPQNKKSIDAVFEIDRDSWNAAKRIITDNYTKPLRNALTPCVKGNHCSCYVDILSIDLDGSVKPCPLSSKKEVIGNVNEISLHEITRRFAQLKKVWMKIPLECKKCPDKLLCHGGCKAHAFLAHGRYDKKDPLCDRNIKR